MAAVFQRGQNSFSICCRLCVWASVCVCSCASWVCVVCCGCSLAPNVVPGSDSRCNCCSVSPISTKPNTSTDDTEHRKAFWSTLGHSIFARTYTKKKQHNNFPLRWFEPQTTTWKKLRAATTDKLQQQCRAEAKEQSTLQYVQQKMCWVSEMDAEGYDVML